MAKKRKGERRRSKSGKTTSCHDALQIEAGLRSVLRCLWEEDGLRREEGSWRNAEESVEAEEEGSVAIEFWWALMFAA